MKQVDFLLINPWIYDFAAYDFWLKPLGLLILGGKLRALGYQVAYLDALDPFHPKLPKKPKRRHFGTGHFFKSPIPKPYQFLDVPRRFFRYGMPVDVFLLELKRYTPKAILLTCTLTYWYPGLITALSLISQTFPDVPVFLGGIYVKLCYEHAVNLVNELFPNKQVKVFRENWEEAIEFFKSYFQPSSSRHPNDYPIFDLQTRIPYVVVLTSFGCPFNCPYCASKRLYPSFKKRSPNEVFKEIEYWYEKFGVKDFAFYDDALLFDFENHLALVLEKVLSKGLKPRFHTPNAVHARFLTKKVAKFLKKSGFETIRIGLERVENRFDNKVSLEEFLEAVANLKEAGFKPKQLGAYLLYGIPYENFNEVIKAIKFLEKVEIPPYLAEFSPIPGTPFFEEAKISSRYPIAEDPIFHNNTAFPALKKPDWNLIAQVKSIAKKVRTRLNSLG